jgi:hypothetical protein
MQDDNGKCGDRADAFVKNTGKGVRQDPRLDRLKLALRENLKRRKSQARGRADLTSATSNIESVSPYDDGPQKTDN